MHSQDFVRCWAAIAASVGVPKCSNVAVHQPELADDRLMQRSVSRAASLVSVSGRLDACIHIFGPAVDANSTDLLDVSTKSREKSNGDQCMLVGGHRFLLSRHRSMRDVRRGR